jgi:DNA-binding transcriptional LysR family regulator
MNKPVDEWTFERGGERKAINVVPSVVTYDREGLIEAVLAGAGVVWLGCFDPGLLSSGRLRRLLPDWHCPAGFPVYAMYRRSGRMPAKLAAVLEFVAEAFAAFDPEEVTLIHREVSEGLGRRAPPSSLRRG